jgi:hypothetical protein
VRLLDLTFDRLTSFSVADRAAAGPLGLGSASARALAGAAAPIAAPIAEPIAEPRQTAHADALRLAVHLRAATGGATGQSLLLCGLLPGQSVRQLVYETALAFVQLQHVPVLVVDLEPGDEDDHAETRGLLPETDAATWLDSGTGRRPAAAALKMFGRPGYLASAAFGQDLAAWRKVAGVVVCCAQPLSDSVDTLAAATRCTGTVLVVPSRGATVEPVMAARDTFTRTGVALLGCVFDTTPAARGGKGRGGAGA